MPRGRTRSAQPRCGHGRQTDYSVLGLRSHPTIPAPMVPSRIAPGAGIGSSTVSPETEENPIGPIVLITFPVCGFKVYSTSFMTAKRVPSWEKAKPAKGGSSQATPVLPIRVAEAVATSNV
jgi:hypothetical protein